MTLKSEIRNPKSEGTSKSEIRTLRARPGASDVGLRISFGFRISGFGFSSPA